MIKVHLSDNSLKKLAKDGITEQEDIEALEHIASCDYCSNRYAVFMEEDLITLPVDFKDKVMAKARKIKKPFLQGKWKFYGYCFRVGFACACSIVLLFSIDTAKIVDMGSKLKGIEYEEVGELLSNTLRSIQEHFKNLEVNLYENEKE